MPLYDSILDTIGRTPIVRLNRMAPDHVTVYVKVESFNPGGSVKDRLALSVILDAEARGLLKPGDTIAECTSGNVGIALAMVAAARGYRFVAVMGDTYSPERRKLIRAYGGKVILFPGALGSSGGNRIADELARKHGWFRVNQFDNPANPAYHRETTAGEILGDFAGRRLDYFVTGFGTTGTLTGVGQMLKLARPEVRVIAVEPDNAAVLNGREWNVHRIQGWAPNFVPSVLDESVIDELLTVDEVVGRDTARRLAAEEGIFAGVSAGATLATALRVAEDAPDGSVLLAMLPDTGERYLSTFLFEGVNEGSDDEWLASLEAGRDAS
ncbi:cysteine synthase A [Streptomyces somaliensis DSM 40738]|uniref:Cysteine synthase n=1 Tax=Streptomyces somaliensis (strain ATCC 33201 / DSM 40738 / JCM 12659 / KCTC 9044 / NCTC 11332 / NRRL B-12077 / IP 733) TaxID=1134445 RepID=A0AA44DAM5_STRE0|nr:cysteine synthase A [Streptomyces somaliensis]MCQ0024273.1 cysteine synthase A [Streptomyces somaliensis DSM 40738]NKY12885.1 cysteine synthase A [Streptomyces somaliensis DSM 40738]